MTFSVVIRCGRDWTPGDPCRQAEPLGIVAGFADARERARRLGWSTVEQAGELDGLLDRCPACTRRETEGSLRRRGTDRRPVDDTALPPGFDPADWSPAPPRPTRPFADRIERRRLPAEVLDTIAAGIAGPLPDRSPVTADVCTLPCCRPASHRPLPPGYVR